jgi:hypothetical protein
MATILLIGVDPLFWEELERLLVTHHVITADNVDMPELVIADIGRVEPEEVAEAYPETPLLGYSSHLDAAGERIAYEAGFDRVIARTALETEIEELVSALTASVE